MITRTLLHHNFTMKYIYANWKSHKNITQAKEWVDLFLSSLSLASKDALDKGKIEVGIFPPSSLIYPVHELLKGKKGFVIGAQDISRYAEGKHTGLMQASSLSGIATHVIIGHAEMRAYGDTQSIVYEKLSRAQDVSLVSIVCVRKSDEYVDEAKFVVYEPEYAIGTGIVATPNEIRKFKSTLPIKNHQLFLYGGSVNEDTVESLMKQNICDGFLIGAASLDAKVFADLVGKIVRSE